MERIANLFVGTAGVVVLLSGGAILGGGVSVGGASVSVKKRKRLVMGRRISLRLCVPFANPGKNGRKGL